MSHPLNALLESVRDALAGRIEDGSQLRELAVRVAGESVELRRRIELSVAYARRGLRLEACSEAEAEPTVHSLALAFATGEMRRWDELCAKRGFLRPEFPSEQSIGEIDEAIAFAAPLRGRLSLMRRLVLSDASAWSRLEVLRELVARDPGNLAWAEDRDALELVAAAELNARIDQDILLGDLRHAETCVGHLEDGKWSQPIAGRLGRQCRRRLGAAQAQRATVDAAALLQQVEAEWAAEDDRAAREALLAWDALARRVAECGGTMPAELAQRAAAAAAWLADRDAHADARRVNAELVDALDRAARDQRTGLEELRRSLRAAEQATEGVPDDIRAVAEGRIAELERSHRFRWLARAAMAVVLTAALGVLALLVSSWADDRRELAAARRLVAEVDAGVSALAATTTGEAADEALRKAEAALEELTRNARTTDGVEAASLRTALGTLRKELEDEREEIDRLLREAGEPASADARPELVERAAARRMSAAQRARVEEWRDGRDRAIAQRRRAEADSLIERARGFRSRMLEESGDPAMDLRSAVDSWRLELASLRQGASGIPEVDPELNLCETAIRNAETIVNRARDALERDTRLAALPSLAARPADLAAALVRFADDYPDAGQSPDFRRTARGAARWQALPSWPGLAKAPRASSPQRELDAVASRVEQHQDAFPGSPLARQCQALSALIPASASWRDALRTSTEQPRFNDWTVDSVDGNGAPVRIRTSRNPAEAERPASPTDPRSAVRATDGRLRIIDLRTAKVARVPEHALVNQLAPYMPGAAPSTNEAIDSLAALRTIIAAADADPLERSAMMVPMLRKMANGMPLSIADRAQAAADALERARALDSVPGRGDGRTAPEATIKALAALAPDSWKLAWDRDLESAWRPLKEGYMGVGIVLRTDSAGEVRLDSLAAPGSRLCALAPDGAIVPIGFVGDSRAFMPDAGVALDVLPSGSPVFALKDGAP